MRSPRSNAGTTSGDLTFDVDAALLFELGEQLVARKSIALAELVKNAYDADATRVTVSFRKVGRAGGTIVVTDDGTGMSLAEVRAGWMRVATTRKIRQPTSKVFGRHTTGSKGVGRFAARKLARRLVLKTTAQVSARTWETTEVSFFWDRFRPGRSLTSITSSFSSRRTRIPRPTGSELEMRGARDIWTAPDVRAVRRDLQDLTPPFTLTELKDSGSQTSIFEVLFDVPEYPELEGSLSQEFLSAALARLEGRVGRGGFPTYRLQLRGRKRGIRFSPKESFASIPGAAFVIHYFRYDRESLAGSQVSVLQARDMGSRHGGVRIYQDGFRVFPYGDPGDDWLQLDADRGRRLTAVDPLLRGIVETADLIRPMLALPGNNNLFGAVFISRSRHPDLRPTISRERFIDNEAFRALQTFLRLGVDWMVVARAREDAALLKRRASRVIDSAEQPTDSTSVVRESIARLRESFSAIQDRQLVTRMTGELVRLEVAIDAEATAGLDKIAVLRILASAGTMVVIFIHQMRAVLDGIRRIARDIGEVGQEVSPAFLTDIDQTRERLQTWTRMMDAQANQLGILLGPEARRTRKEIVIKPVVQAVFSTFASYAQDRGIELRNSVSPASRTPPMFEAELHSVLLNALTNSLKAVREQRERVIEVSSTRSVRNVVIEISDTGMGVSRADRERVFDPFVTTSVPDPVLGAGTGIGLAIVRDIAEENGGTARFVEPAAGWKTTLRLEVPRGLSN
jgi:signal transduction histidine kinase